MNVAFFYALLTAAKKLRDYARRVSGWHCPAAFSFLIAAINYEMLCRSHPYRKSLLGHFSITIRESTDSFGKSRQQELSPQPKVQKAAEAV